ncbi:MAG: SGNH/GDSL hydrolase family protein [Nitrospirae bacterium]|nr:SGNH/GDSL hydrolase family protein [Candidatus Manganitrophaceae bacterium]
MLLKKWGRSIILITFFLLPLSVQAETLSKQSTQPLDQPTRYMALGDSLAAGQGALPATRGYVYLLYHWGVFDSIPNTILNDAGVSGATSQLVLEHQVPQAIEAFEPTDITITVGGNDLFTILDGADVTTVLGQFQANLTQIFQALRTALPNTRIYINNLYIIPEIAGSDQVVPLFNQILEKVAAEFNVPVADVYSAFLGKKGLIHRNSVHPTNAGYRVIATAFAKVIKPH